LTNPGNKKNRKETKRKTKKEEQRAASWFGKN
jgi:hypothetical protein